MAIRTHIDIVSAHESIYAGQAEQIIVPTQLGELGILARHAPLIAQLKPGLVRVILGNEIKEEVFVTTGILEVQPHIVTILADTVLRSAELDKAAADAARYVEEQSNKQRKNLDSELALNIALLRALDEVKRTRSDKPIWSGNKNE